MVPLVIDTFSLKLGVSGDSILGIFAKGKLLLRCISNLTLGVTNEGREAISHIGVKRMKKLHTDGLLESLDFESFDTCEPCLMGKMTKTPFSGTMERATNLLEI